MYRYYASRLLIAFPRGVLNCEISPRFGFDLTLNADRDGGMRGMFAGVGPRVGRAGPSVGIVVSFYEVVKYVLQRQYNTT